MTQYDPNLHARVAVLENDNKRHDEDINQLWGKVSALEICAASLPQINELLRSISAKVENLTNCAVKEDGQRIAFLTVREWVLAGVAIAALLLEHFIIK
jgi:hypothetical protein